MAGVAFDGSPWVTGLQASGVVFATLGCTVVGAALAARAVSKRMEEGGYEAAAPARRRFKPEEYAASQQQQQQADWKEEPEALYEQQPSDHRE